jgi:hypothetical protein
MESTVQKIEERLTAVEASLADLKRECAKMVAEFVEKEPVKPPPFQMDSHLILMA